MYKHPSNELMKRCIFLAKDGLESRQYALAALVADENGKILYETSSKLIKSYDPTAHPEIVALRKSAELIKSRYLKGCYLYTTLEPCPMCTSAAIWAKLDGIVFGAYQEDAIEYAKKNPSEIFTWRQIELPAAVVAERGKPKIKIFPGVLREKCKELFSLCYI